MSFENTQIGYEHATSAGENRIDSTLSDSFPASDPPDWTGIARIGCPAHNDGTRHVGISSRYKYAWARIAQSVNHWLLDPALGKELVMSYTSEEQFAACERSDKALDLFLGQTLQEAVLRMAVLSTLAGVIVVYLLPIVI
jgi:hypothetical protein